MTSKLNLRQRAMGRFYAIHGNKRDAARQAGYKESTIDRCCHDWHSSPEFMEYTDNFKKDLIFYIQYIKKAMELAEKAHDYKAMATLSSKFSKVAEIDAALNNRANEIDDIQIPKFVQKKRVEEEKQPEVEQEAKKPLFDRINEYKLTLGEKEALFKATIEDNEFIPDEYKPTEKQKSFLLSDKRELMYGGAAGGGKSVALLMAALMYVDIPNYKALLLRRTYSQLALPCALMDMAHNWLHGKKDVKWCDKNKQWEFPSGATLTFGYLDTDRDKYRYQGAAFHFIGFDELTQFTEQQYLYLFSRSRKSMTTEIPLRFRAASNPGGVGHEWVKNRFIDSKGEERGFIPAGANDNPHLNQVEYEKNLNELDPVTRKQLRDGDWEVQQSGNFFRREKFQIVDDYPKKSKVVRYWDMAASENIKADYTAGVKMCMYEGQYWIIDVIRAQNNPGQNEELIRQTAELDGREVPVFMEEEPGSSGKNTIDNYARKVLAGFAFKGVRSTGKKVTRSKPFAASVENNNVKLVKGSWNRAFIDECVIFPQQGYHDDMVDAAAGAFEQLNGGPSGNPQITTHKVDRRSDAVRGY